MHLSNDATPMDADPIVWIITGVAGSGKTLVGRLLAAQLECDFLEGDRRHPIRNVVKMLAQQPLTDIDRAEWLQAMVVDIQRAIAHRYETVLTCSALKQTYREQLQVSDRVQLVWINVTEMELQRRLAQRADHYMQSAMLRSQLAAFEPLTPSEKAITVDGTQLPDAIVGEILTQAKHRFPGLARSWWERV